MIGSLERLFGEVPESDDNDSQTNADDAYDHAGTEPRK